MRRLKIIADDKIPFLKGVLEPYSDMVYLPGAAITAADVQHADAVLTRTRTKCNSALLEGSNVKLIATATIGYDHIDTEWCEANGIRWVNAPGCNSSSVRQYIAAAIATWVQNKNLQFKDLTLGVIGVGNVGGKVASIGRTLGMKVLLNDPPRAEKEGCSRFTDLDTLLTNSDIVTCHTPLTKDGKYPTWHLSDSAFFDSMKPNALYINSSRGQVTDSTALRQAAKNKLAGFILDVWEGEPTPDTELLTNAFIATPHIAGYSADGKANGTAACVREISNFFGINELNDWYPATVPPPPMSTTIVADAAGKSFEQLIYEVITHTYPILEDSNLLKQSPETFEKQRGDYHIRREFGSFALQLKNAAQDVADILKNIGFNIV